MTNMSTVMSWYSVFSCHILDGRPEKHACTCIGASLQFSFVSRKYLPDYTHAP